MEGDCDSYKPQLSPEDIFQYIISGIVLIISAALVSMVYAITTATGKIDYCYIHEQSFTDHGSLTITKRYYLYGFRDWRSDSLIVTSPTYDEAIANAKKIGCLFGVEP